VESEQQPGIFVAGFVLAAMAIIVTPITAIGIISAVRDKSTATATVATTANVSLKEFSITGDLAVPAGNVTLAITNAGSQVHNLALKNGAGTKNISSGQTDTLSLGTLAPGTYTLACLIPGHEAAGMHAELTVTAGAAQAASGSTGGAHDHNATTDYVALDKVMTDSILKFPATTKGQGNEPLAPKILADGTKEFDLTTEIVDWEVSPGKIVQAWAYNAMVPGPMIHTDVGDKVKLVVTNKLPMGTDVHVHGIEMPFEMDGVSPITQQLIAPNTTFTYSFTTDKAAVAMYHAHNHGDVQITNGLFGTFIVGAMALPAGRTISGVSIPTDVKVSQEIPMVLNDAGVIGLSLNGKSFPATQPYKAKVGDWIEIHYFNEGLQIHPMHQHRFPQLVIAKDGIALDQPYWVDTLTVAPGERYTVLMHPDAKGTWVWHCHILNHVESDTGAFGMLTAWIIE